MATTKNFEEWLLKTATGKKFLQLEQVFYHNLTLRVFGYHAIQIGLDQIDFLQNNKISNKYVINKQIKCEPFFLPFASETIDLIICPHLIELIPNYHIFLQECHRVLIPNGTIIISAFNSKSIYKPLFKLNHAFDKLNFVDLDLLKTQLQALGLRITGGKYLSYTPPINNAKLLSRLNFMDKIGDRWFPTLANIFAITITKDVLPYNLVNQKSSLYNQNISPQLGTLSNAK